MNMLIRQYTSIVKATASFILLMVFASVQAGEVTYGDNTYSAGDTLTAADLNAKFNDIKAAVNDNNANSASKQTRVSGTCMMGSSIREIASDGSVICEVDNAKVSGVEGIYSTASTTLTSTSYVELASLTINDVGTVNVALNAHFSVEISGSTTARLQAEIKQNDCSGTVLGQAMWRPGGAASDGILNAVTLSLTGFQSSVALPATYVLCARKYFDASFPNALVYYRGFNLTYSN